ncbi:hypothetical protein [Bradyrhizobium sp.]|uniref:hypothetical protein n=1 Tax=Bradyrhizobium sp. TaxID=376 RepID=UPI001D79AD7B|nr:hypothetical protein [Bradyrhizobium sp.]MBV8700645.1 hypothetical protein [Bradyrhizobium sp.]MBV8923688.1 hypothetical protein [Bradyrhizobium sp.]MBV9981774.1 hypothetical protein [Bradyrhizobium sp.]
MASSSTTGVHLVRVLTDDRANRLWVAAASSPEEAVNLVLSAIPEGWSASLLQEQLTPAEIEGLNLKHGEAHQITRTIRMS